MLSLSYFGLKFCDNYNIIKLKCITVVYCCNNNVDSLLCSQKFLFENNVYNFMHLDQIIGDMLFLSSLFVCLLPALIYTLAFKL